MCVKNELQIAMHIWTIGTILMCDKFFMISVLVTDFCARTKLICLAETGNGKYDVSLKNVLKTLKFSWQLLVL